MVEAVRRAIESLWEGRCTVTHRVKERDATGQTVLAEVVLHEDVPCRLSYASAPAAAMADGVAPLAQVTKLFLSPAVDMPSGCKIAVTQHGQETTYRSSGEPAVHTHHQEIVLALFEGWA